MIAEDLICYAGPNVNGEQYFIVKSPDDNKQAIINNKGDIVSFWHDVVYSYGLVSMQSKYYLAMDGGSFYIYDKDHNQIAGPSSLIYPDGLVKNESQYYIAKHSTKYGDKLAVFDRNGNQITPDFDGIVRKGLIRGTCDYYVGLDNTEHGYLYVLGHKDKGLITPYMRVIPIPETVNQHSRYFLAVSPFTAIHSPEQSNSKNYFVVSKMGEIYSKHNLLASAEKVLNQLRSKEQSVNVNITADQQRYIPSPSL